MRYTIVQDSKGYTYPLFGVSAELVQWLWEGLKDIGDSSSPNSGSLVARALLRGSAYPKTSDGVKKLKDTLLLFIGGSLGHDLQTAEEFMYEHWHAHVELGPYPCPYWLSKAEASRVFYPDYREHVIHQLRVYLLGLWIFDKHKKLQEAILEEIKNTSPNKTGSYKDKGELQEAFFIRWAAAALAHDVGYALENDQIYPGGPRELWKNFAQNFNNMIEIPIAPTLGLWENSREGENSGNLSGALKEINKTLSKTLEFNLGENPEQLEDELIFLGKSEKRKLCWEKFNGAARRVKLNESKNNQTVLEDYYRGVYKEGFQYENSNRKFLDHGITSSLLLMRSWFAYQNYVMLLAERATEPEEQEDFFARDAFHLACQKKGISSFEDWCSKLPNEDHLLAAATAIVLHNIDPSQKGNWTGSEYRARIDISFSSAKNALPLAFLLRLADELQQWDRKKFRTLKSGEYLPESRGYSLRYRAEKDKFFLLFREDFFGSDGLPKAAPWPPDDEKSWYRRTVDGMKVALKEEDIKACVDFDGAINNTGEGPQPDVKATFENATRLEVFWPPNSLPIPLFHSLLDSLDISQIFSFINSYMVLDNSRHEEWSKFLSSSGSSSIEEDKRGNGSGGWSARKHDKKLMDSRIKEVLIKSDGQLKFSSCGGTKNWKQGECGVCHQAAYFIADTCKVHDANAKVIDALPHIDSLVINTSLLVQQMLKPQNYTDHDRQETFRCIIGAIYGFGICDWKEQASFDKKAEKYRDFFLLLDFKEKEASDFSEMICEIIKAEKCIEKRIDNLGRKFFRNESKFVEYVQKLHFSVKRVLDSRTRDIQDVFEKQFDENLTHEEMSEGLYKKNIKPPHYRKSDSVWE